NRGSILNLNYYNAQLNIRENGKIIKVIELPEVNLDGGDSTIMFLKKFITIKPSKNKEYQIDFQFSLKNDMPWAKAGHVVSTSQLRWIEFDKYSTPKSAQNKLEIIENTDRYSVKGKAIKVIFDKKTGALTQYNYNGKNIIASDLLPSFTRPATDNERRGWKPHVKLKYWYNTPILQSITHKESSEGIILNAKYNMPGDSALIQIAYTIKSSGIIDVNYDLQVKSGLPNVPKIGLKMGINPNFNQIEYYGLGAMETYSDRAYGFDLGQYKMSLDEFTEPYLVPQENGNRMDVRWFTLRDNKNAGVLILGNQALNVNASYFSLEQMQNTKHWYKLKKEDKITLNVDYKTMGIGGNDTWTDISQPLPHYQVPATDDSYSFS